MSALANAAVVLVALLHLYFLTLEMFLWATPRGLKTFGNTPERAKDTAVLAANQGLYNGFLAAGLIWGVLHPVAATGFQIKTFFLVCIIVAGVYGGFSATRKILYVQALPALLALALVWIA